MHLVHRCALLALLVAWSWSADVTLTVAATTNAGGPVTYAWSVVAMPAGATAPTLTSTSPSSTTARATFAATALPGTYLVQVQVTDGTSPAATSQTAIQVTRSQAITFGNAQTSFTYDPAQVVDVDPQASTTAPGLGVVYRVVGTSAVATIVGNRIRPQGTGTVEIEADVEAHTPVRYRSALVRRTYTFAAPARAAQTIQVRATTLTAVKGTRSVTLALGATSSSGLPLVYGVSDPQVATVASDGTITVLRVGTATITIDQPGDARTAPAPQVTVRLTVSAAAITIGQALSATPATLDLP